MDTHMLAIIVPIKSGTIKHFWRIKVVFLCKPEEVFCEYFIL